MKANELRIGNFILESYGGIYVVKTISWAGFIGLSKPEMNFVGDYLIEGLQSVPLTAKWLLKFGFGKVNGDTFTIDKTFFGLIYNDAIGFRFSIDGQYAYPEIKYVHQLQNLYFAVTGEELQLKDETVI